MLVGVCLSVFDVNDITHERLDGVGSYLFCQWGLTNLENDSILAPERLFLSGLSFYLYRVLNKLWSRFNVCWIALVLGK